MINLYSDTQTRPTAGMREAMASAEVGDEQSFADPTVNELCSRVADLLGFEAAVFLPSGTMCNAIAFRLHIGPGGDEVVEQLSVLRDAGLSRVMLQHLLHTDLETVELIGRKLAPAVAA